jgi:hypothetical protein
MYRVLPYTNQHTNQFMGYSLPGEANGCSPTQEIGIILWSLKIHYSYHKISSFVPTLSQLRAVPTL